MFYLSQVKVREVTRIADKNYVYGGIKPQSLLTCMACPNRTIWRITFAPVSPGAPRPPSAPDRPCKVKHRIPLRHHILCTTVCSAYAIFMNQKTQHINIETCYRPIHIHDEFNYMDHTWTMITLPLIFYTVWEMFSLTLFPGFPLRPAGPGNPRGPLNERNKKQTERWRWWVQGFFFKGYWM